MVRLDDVGAGRRGKVTSAPGAEKSVLRHREVTSVPTPRPTEKSKSPSGQGQSPPPPVKSPLEGIRGARPPTPPAKALEKPAPSALRRPTSGQTSPPLKEKSFLNIVIMYIYIRYYIMRHNHHIIYTYYSALSYTRAHLLSYHITHFCTHGERTRGAECQPARSDNGEEACSADRQEDGQQQGGGGQPKEHSRPTQEV